MSLVPIEIHKQFYRPICNEEEIERIFNLKTSNDFLLKLRADTIVDHMRLYRVYRNKALSKGKEWSLESSFCSYHYINFKNKLPKDLLKECEKITCGNIFSNEPNGQIFKSDYGIIATLSDSLNYFFEFMNLGLLDFGKQVPEQVRINAIRIALRVMLQTESLDFLIDPRGIISKEIQQKTQKSVPFQMQFIAGHEYSHFLLGHLAEDNTSTQHVFKALFNSQSNYKPLDVYNTSQKQELDADLSSINLPQYTLKERMLVFEAALLLFACLDIYEGVRDSISPPIGYQNHPPARERYFNLLNNIQTHNDFDYKYWKKSLPETLDFYRNFFIEDASIYIDNYEMYGSVYLDMPNSKWRGKELIDRVDYY